jgi:excinuclease ABC subunit A
VVDFITELPQNTEVLIYVPLIVDGKRTVLQHLQILLQQGFSRVLLNDEVKRIETVINGKKDDDDISGDCFLIIDRIRVSAKDDDFVSRVADSVQTAFYEGHGGLKVRYTINGNVSRRDFSNKFELDGIVFEEPSVNMFSFNNPYGACKRCEGFGTVIGIDEDLVIPDKRLSVYEGAVVCWRGEKMGKWKDNVVKNAYKCDFPIHKPYYRLTANQKKMLWEGCECFEGINTFFKYLEEESYKIQYRVMLSRYRGKTVCPVCKGTRLRYDASYVKIAGRSITELVNMQLDELSLFFQNLTLSPYEQKVAKRILEEINQRIGFLLDVGLGYLTLNRQSSTLSGGESQRINLATSLGSSLVGSMYILDEPTIGLHPRDTHRLLKVLKRLRDIGNTVIVVEHDEDIIKAADEIIDIGPFSGENGGELVFQGGFQELDKNEGLTALYLTGRKKIDVPVSRRRFRNYIELKGAMEHNLKNINVKFPLNTLTVVTGVSGSGKSTLVKDVLYTALNNLLFDINGKKGGFLSLEGDLSSISAVEYVDQNPIGRSSRSNPATYLKAFDDIRQLFARQQLSKLRGYKPGFFSFNIPGGRCEQCEGEGVIKVEMQFMADIYLKCDACNGKRYKDETLEVKFRDKNIADILDLTVDEAIAFFLNGDEGQLERRIVEKIKPLQDVGLGYLRLGQPSNTLSGGEAQRIKLAYFLSKGDISNPLFFIFDEPTTGLHVHDVGKLLNSFYALIEQGHTVLVVEHNAEIIKSADWIIDLGPEGGDKGGEVVFEGVPEDIVKCEKSYTGKFLKDKIIQ